MIHTEDAASIQRMLGVEEIPAELATECAIRARMFHAGGGSGPLGSIALISMIRELGFSPPSVAKTNDRIEWRNYPQDGSLRVEARFFGHWSPGSFHGFVEAGTLAIRLDGDPMVRECRPDMVRIAEDQTPPAQITDRVSAFDPQPTDAPDEPVEETDIDEDDEPTFDWHEVTRGTALFVNAEEGPVEAEFIKFCEESSTVVVKFAGAKRHTEIAADNVVLAAPVGSQ